MALFLNVQKRRRSIIRLPPYYFSRHIIDLFNIISTSPIWNARAYKGTVVHVNVVDLSSRARIKGGTSGRPIGPL